MKEYEGLQMPESGKHDSSLNFNKIQEAYCSSRCMTCESNCSSCLFSREHIDKFQKMYTEKMFW
jgi:hypothetical protein